jgi:putative ATP-binding cassette transporter
LTLGRLMQSAQAFQQVTAALSWPVDNLPRIAEWRASVERVLALEEAVQVVALESARAGDTAINMDRAPGPWLGVSDLWVAEPDGTALLNNLTLRIEPGEHVLVDGDPEAAAAFFRVVAGIWPWGYGRIDLPADALMIAIGRRLFLPQGTLRNAWRCRKWRATPMTAPFSIRCPPSGSNGFPSVSTTPRIGRRC